MCWSPCLTFLEKSIFTNLRRLRSVLMSSEAIIDFGKDVRNRLIEIIDGSPLAEQKLTRLIWKFSDDPMIVLNRKIWGFFKEAIYWYWEHLLKPRIEGRMGSTLLEFISKAPADLGNVFNCIYEEMKESLIPHNLKGKEKLTNLQYPIFCTELLLRDLFRQLLQNCSDHYNKESRSEMDIVVDVYSEVEYTVFRMTNDKSIQSPNPGKGISIIMQRLSAFDAELTTCSRLPDPWSFEVRIKFLTGV
jgi:hypothetical protein